MNHQVTLDVDHERCARDGLCVRECPLGLIELDEDDFPRLRKAAERLCIGCGHCVAICPKAALCLNGRDPETLTLVDRSWKPDPDKLRGFLAARRSIRSYKPEPQERGEIKRLLDAARFAPTAVNAQPVHWAVTLDPARTRELAGLTVDWMKSVPDMPYKGWLAAWDRGEDKILHGAPHLVLAHSPETARWPQVDCATAVAWVEIMAWAMGLGTCWAGIFTRAAQQWEPLQKALALPAGHVTQAAVMLGRPAVRYARIPERLPLRVQWL